MTKLFKKIKIGDIGKVITGKTPPTKEKRFYGYDYPFITPSDIKTFDVRYLEKFERYVSHDWAVLKEKDLLPPNSICYVCIGSTVGKICMNESPSFTNQQINSIICDPEIINPKYLFYKLKTETRRIQSIANAKGSGKSIINKTEFSNLEIEIHSIKDQEKIAAILSAYDDLIENNNHRIKILEKIAQTIYLDWFVKYRFPGYENVNMIKSELGIIPEGWEIKKLGDVLKIHRGKSYKSSELVKTGGLPFVNLKCVDRQGGFRLSGLKRFIGQYKETQVVTGGDIVLAVTDMTQKREIIGRPALIPKTDEKKMIISLDLVKIEPKNEDKNLFIYGFLRYTNFGNQIKEYATGVNVLHLNPSLITEYPIIVPPSTLINKFEEQFSHIYTLIDLLNLKNKKSRQTRDLLLPKLISGKINVENMDIKTLEMEI